MTRTILKNILKYYLKYTAKLALLAHRPTIIAIAGSTNKPFVKKEIKKVLEEMGLSVRANRKNFNTAFGLPLAVLDLPSGYNSYKNWLPAIKEAPKNIFKKNFPAYLVLGLGTSDPGDIKYLLSIVKPKITVITDITQRYLEGFSDMDELVKEYELLAQKTMSDGLLVINYDNERLKKIDAPAKKISFGASSGANWQISGVKKVKEGQSAIIDNGQRSNKVLINKFGLHHIYAHTVAQIIKSYVAK